MLVREAILLQVHGTATSPCDEGRVAMHLLQPAPETRSPVLPQPRLPHAKVTLDPHRRLARLVILHCQAGRDLVRHHPSRDQCTEPRRRHRDRGYTWSDWVRRNKWYPGGSRGHRRFCNHCRKPRRYDHHHGPRAHRLTMTILTAVSSNSLTSKGGQGKLMHFSPFSPIPHTQEHGAPGESPPLRQCCEQKIHPVLYCLHEKISYMNGSVTCVNGDVSNQEYYSPRCDMRIL